MSLVEPGTFSAPDGIYLLSHAVGLPPRDARTRVAAAIFDVWESDPARAWPRWLDEVAGLNRALARLLRHRPECFCPQANVSSALAKVLGALAVADDRRTVLLSANAFPSLGYVADRAARLGYQLTLVPRHEDTRDPDRWAAWMTHDVGVVVITHVHPNTGEQVPVPAIIEQARQNGIITIVDVAQSAGVLPIDLTAWSADFVIGSCVKWLCGGPGAGYLWVNPEIVERCEPLDVGWFSHEDPFELDIERFRYADDARRFWGGTPSVVPAAIARRSIELLTEIGIHRVRSHNLTLTDRLVAHLDDQVLASPRGQHDRGGTVVIDTGPHADRLLQRFADTGIHVDRRRSGIRISPHIYNTTDDIDTVIAALTSITQSL